MLGSSMQNEENYISCAIDQLGEEAKFLPELTGTINALAAFAKTLIPGSMYRKEGERFVLRPCAFATFTVRRKRSHHLTITLRGNIGEFAVERELPLINDRGSAYASCNLRSPDGLAAAAGYIKRACEIYNRGRTRILKKPVITEEQLAGQ